MFETLSYRQNDPLIRHQFDDRVYGEDAVVNFQKYRQEAETLGQEAMKRLSDKTVDLLELAQAESRALDDNHVGTEHLVLGLYALDENEVLKQMTGFI